MEVLIIIAAVFFLATCCYRNGKRTGSIKGYNVGRNFGRRRR